MAFWSWSKTAATNSSADATINWAEGQAPSSVNDSARAMMARTAEYRDDIAGAIVTGGTSTAYTVTSYEVFDTLAHMANQMIAFTPHTTNGATVTLNVDSLGAKPLRSAPSSELLAGVLIQGTPYVATYNNSDAAWYLQNFYGNPYNVPLAGGMDYWGSTVPNTSFAFPIGQQISQTTYATLYALFGANKYGADGGGLFYLPDKTGRVSAMKEAAAVRLTSTYFGGNSTTLGAVGGAESQTLTAGQIPAHTHSGTTGNESVNHTHTGGGTVNGLTYASSGGAGQGFSAGITGGNNQSHTHAFTTDNGTGGGSAHPIVQPTIVCNYILRII